MLHLPNFREESMGTAIEGVRTIIDFQLVWLTIQLKLPLGNAVTISAHNSPVKPIVWLPVSREILVTQYHINKRPALIRHVQAHDAGTIIGNRRYHLAISQCIQFDGITTYFRLEISWRDEQSG